MILKKSESKGCINGKGVYAVKCSEIDIEVDDREILSWEDIEKGVNFSVWRTHSGQFETYTALSRMEIVTDSVSIDVADPFHIFNNRAKGFCRKRFTQKYPYKSTAEENSKIENEKKALLDSHKKTENLFGALNTGYIGSQNVI